MAKDSAAVAEKPAEVSVSLEAALKRELTPEQQRAANAALWRERLLSLWSPITIFGILLALYIVVVELDTPAFHVAQPILKGLGLVALIAFVILALLRWVWKPFGELRTARHEAKDVLAEVDGALKNKGIAQNLRQEAVKKASELEIAYATSDAAVILKQAEDLRLFAEKQLGRKKYGADFAWGFVKAFAIAMAIRAIIIEPFKIPSGSMIPTLEIGDQIFVNKFLYGVQIPFTETVPFKLIREPQRGDVIVFKNPVIPGKDFIKRVIGIPGDVITLQKDVLNINGQTMDRSLVDANYTYMEEGADWVAKHAVRYEENLSGHLHPTLQQPEQSCTQNFNEGQPFTVPPGNVFVMGDNRDNSADSRFGLASTPPCVEHITFVPYGNIKGKAMIIWLSLSHGGLFSSVFGGTGLRTDRLFLPVR